MRYPPHCFMLTQALIRRYAQLNPRMTLHVSLGERRTKKFNRKLSRRRSRSSPGTSATSRRSQLAKSPASSFSLPGLPRRQDSSPSGSMARFQLDFSKTSGSARPQSSMASYSSTPTMFASFAPPTSASAKRQRSKSAHVSRSGSGFGASARHNTGSHRRRSRLAARVVAGVDRCPIVALPPLSCENEYVVPALVRIATASSSRVSSRWLSVLSVLAPALRTIEVAIAEARQFMHGALSAGRSGAGSHSQVSPSGANDPGAGTAATDNALQQLKQRVLEAVYSDDAFSVANVTGSGILNVNESLTSSGPIKWPALLHACAGNCNSVAKHLLRQSGIDATFRCPITGLSPLLAACWHGNIVVVELILRNLAQLPRDVETPPLAAAQRQATRGQVEVCICDTMCAGRFFDRPNARLLLHSH